MNLIGLVRGFFDFSKLERGHEAMEQYFQCMALTSHIFLHCSTEGLYTKSGAGRSSGLGEFWNVEFAKNPAAIAAACLSIFCSWVSETAGRLAILPNSVCSSDPIEEESSSEDILNTPSLGALTCFRPALRPGDGVGVARKGN